MSPTRLEAIHCLIEPRMTPDGGAGRRWRAFDERWLKPHFGGQSKHKLHRRINAIGESDSESG